MKFQKTLLIAASVVTTSMIAAPVSASAHSHGNANWAAQRQARACAKYDWRHAKLFGRFDQNNRWQNKKIQNVINKENDRGCEQSADVVDTLVENGNFKTLTAAVGAAGLIDTLKTPGDKTIFAPTDQAFAKLPAGTVESLLGNIPALTDILTYHVIGGASVDAGTAKTLTEATPLNNKKLNVSVRHGKLFINESRVVLYDIKTSNGIIHVIDTVLLPPSS